LIDLFGADRPTLENYFLELEDKPFRAVQLVKWIHQRGEYDFAKMSDFPKTLRTQLSNDEIFQLPQIEKVVIDYDGVVKWLFRLHDDNIIETVFIPENNRGTLCISSQVGCYLDCRFCATALQGFNRNLASAEIIAQVWLARQQLSEISATEEWKNKRWNDLPLSSKVTNVVLMGMGEPLLNVKQVMPAVRLMLDDNAYGLSKRKVTISTAGIAPMMSSLPQECEASLALSLHSAIDSVRDILVPLNKKYDIKTLMSACWDYIKAHNHRRHILFEYVMLKGVNDDDKHVRALIRLLGDFPAKINLIPFNPYPKLPYQCSSMKTIHRFQDQLKKRDINTTIRKTRGNQIQAACGQLSGEVQDRTNRLTRLKTIEFA
jgi:23S rRNA (adenine2503-C2)-methyltransferase